VYLLHYRVSEQRAFVQIWDILYVE